MLHIFSANLTQLSHSCECSNVGPDPVTPEYRGEGAEPTRSRQVPWLQMRGDWLSAAGFDIRAPVRVRVMPGCLVLTVEES